MTDLTPCPNCGGTGLVRFDPADRAAQEDRQAAERELNRELGEQMRLAARDLMHERSWQSPMQPGGPG